MSYGGSMVDDTEEERQRFILEMSRIVDALRERSASQEVDWDPLHAVLAYEQCHGFMWMDRVSWRGRTLEVYKHGITRRSLHLDHEGRAYLYRGDSYKEISMSDAMERVFEDIEEMGATRETPYDEAYRREKYRKARELGWTIIS